MPKESDFDLVRRTLSGERRARITLFREYIRANPNVIHAGAACADVDDFLQDCFHNFLSTLHAWDKEEPLVSWVESVAAWTALQHARMSSLPTAGLEGRIRMCAEMEGEPKEAETPAYVPPAGSPGDTPAALVYGLLPDVQRTVFQKRAGEGASWEEIAAAIGKPLDSLGPVFSRGLNRAARLFGAPPPLDEDLEPTFTRALDKRGTSETREAPRGRAISIQRDRAFYVSSPDLQRLGVGTSREARAILLWDAATAVTPPSDTLRAHLNACNYCTALLRSLLLLHQALRLGPEHTFQFCPGAFSLGNVPELARPEFDRHLASCRSCTQERASLQSEGASPEAPLRGRGAKPKRRNARLWAVAASLLVLALGSFGAYRNFYPARKVSAAKALGAGPNFDSIAPDPRYNDLISAVKLDDAKVLAAALPENRPLIRRALDNLALGDQQGSLSITSQLVERSPDPAAHLLYAMALYHNNLITDGYRAMMKAEAMAPRDPYRCWILLQFSLMVAENSMIEREAGHLAGDPEFGPRARAILEKVRQRK